MISRIYLDAAHRAIRDSAEANQKGEYISAWGKSLSARLNYLADAVVNASAAPLYAIGFLYGLLEAVITWGRETVYLAESLKGIDNSLSRVFFGGLGAVVSPIAASAFEVDSALELLGTVTLVAAVAGGVVFLANKLRLPNLVFYNAQTGFIWGWN